MIRIVEISPRDGLQNEPETVPSDKKIAFIDALSRSGVDEIEVTSFVSHERIPQLADAEIVLAGIERRAGVTYSVLVPNQRGLERALPLKPDKIAVFTAASETFSQKNVNATIEQTFARFVPAVRDARAAGLQVRGYVSTVFWCPYEGKIGVDRVMPVVERLFALGCDEVALGDTVGKATPEEVRELLAVVVESVPKERLALHFHDTYGRAARNVLAGYELGITRFDASCSGIGGCPYAPGAAGNVATDLVVRSLAHVGAEVRVDLDVLAEAREHIAPYIGADRR